MPFQSDLQRAYEAGYITLRKIRGEYWGDKLHDHAALVAIWGHPAFKEEDYDRVLFAAGAPPWEMGLAVIEDD
jgi:hypothetical protein